MDPKLVEKIVHEVKSQGVFDEFRRDSIADVDTKPAYQNLRQRVETTVKKFLSEQKWSPYLNKIQLRERLRKHITDSGFLDVGVERIVDQVVNPKIGKVFQPKIEDIAYKYLGIPKPPQVETFNLIHQLSNFPVNGNALKVETSQLLPNDLEQISPDSDRGTIKSEDRDQAVEMDVDDKTDEEDESPPFEPIENTEAMTTKTEEDFFKNKHPVSARNHEKTDQQQQKKHEVREETEVNISSCLAAHDTSSEQDASQKTVEQGSDKDNTHERIHMSQESHSQLSQISSNSCLSGERRSNQNDGRDFNSKSHENAVNISEEAQMPRFSSENSNEENADKSNGKKNELHFDIKQDEIKFEGTKRKSTVQPPEITSQTSSDSMNKGTLRDEEPNQKRHSSTSDLSLFQDEGDDHNFKFAKIYVRPEQAEQTAKEISLNAVSLEDSTTDQLCIVDKSENTQISLPTSVKGETNDMNENESMETPSLVIVISNSDSNFDRIEKLPCVADAASNLSPAAITTKAPAALSATAMSETAAEITTTTTTTTAQTTTTTPTTISTRHRKHFKKKSEKDTNSEKDRERENPRFREKLRRRSTSKTSSASKSYHSSSRRSGKGKEADLSQTKSKQISGSKDRDESKYSTRSREIEKNKKSAHQGDDHYAAKDKIYWRKSTDSNDEDKDAAGVEKLSSKLNPPEFDKGKNTSADTKNKNKGENKKLTKTSSQSENAVKSIDEYVQTAKCSSNQENSCHPSRIVILNEVLENPTTNFIELSGMTSQDSSCIHIERTDDLNKIDEGKKTNRLDGFDSDSDSEVNFFENDANQFLGRLQLIDNTINNCRKVVNYFRFGSQSPLRSDIPESKYINTTPTNTHTTLPRGSKHSLSCETRATLHIDCIQYVKTACEKATFDGKQERNKRSKCQNEEKLASPTSSEASVNSKENEFIPAGITVPSRHRSKNSSMTAVEQGPSLKKVDQQRYTSDDLYKPRLFQGQRSRRRGLLDVKRLLEFDKKE